VAGSSPFFLAGRTAAVLLGVSHAQTARWLRLLAMDGVLMRVSVGTRCKATEYLYVGD
jgi:hypothetical protein